MTRPRSFRDDLAAVFDAEWEFALEAAKRTQDLRAIHDLLGASCSMRATGHHERKAFTLLAMEGRGSPGD